MVFRLLSHVNDPTIDDRSARDYILYLCPVGQLQQELLDFWQKSYQDCGWNRAHNYFPHITLCSFFQVITQHSLITCNVISSQYILFILRERGGLNIRYDCQVIMLHKLWLYSRLSSLT